MHIFASHLETSFSPQSPIIPILRGCTIFYQPALITDNYRLVMADTDKITDFTYLYFE